MVVIDLLMDDPLILAADGPTVHATARGVECIRCDRYRPWPLDSDPLDDSLADPCGLAPSSAIASPEKLGAKVTASWD